jgi:choline dehydrogenase
MGRKQAQRFDYIIIGAGSAGGLLTFRLSQNPDIRALLIDAGSGDHHWSIRSCLCMVSPGCGSRMPR